MPTALLLPGMEMAATRRCRRLVWAACGQGSHPAKTLALCTVAALHSAGMLALGTARAAPPPPAQRVAPAARGWGLGSIGFGV